MKFEVQSTVSLMFLSIMNLCLCVQNFAEKTFNSLSAEIHHTKRHQNNLKWSNENFLLIDYLSDGEMERRISYKGITAKETSIANNSKSLSLWQLSNGVAFIQMIYSREDELLDCEYVRQTGFVTGFLKKFYEEIDLARLRNFTTPNYNHYRKSLTNDYEELLRNEYFNQPMEDAFGMRNLVYKNITKDTDLPEDLKPLMNYNSLKLQCDEKHREMEKIVQNLQSDHEEDRKNATEHLERRKRSLSDWIMAPNTKWCGRGQIASKYNQLGGASKADKCCRRHDHCRFIIHAMTTKWHMFNYRPFTISHCSCDTRFRTCLKMADSSDATMVGKVFFNIVQTKCFVLKPEKICKKRSWWGKCEKKGIRKRAHLRSNRQF